MSSCKNSRKKLLVASILIIIVIILFFIIQSIQLIMINSAAMPEIMVDPSSLVVEKGEEFSINISINPAYAPISAAQFNLLFDSSIINIQKVTEGDFFKRGGAKTTFNSGTQDKKRGVLINVWGLIITPGANVTANGTLAVIRMVANNTGKSQLNLSDIIISSPGGNSIGIKIRNGSVGVRDGVNFWILCLWFNKIYPVDPVNPVKRCFYYGFWLNFRKVILMKECAKNGLYGCSWEKWLPGRL